jgi:AcrR family transcriptional regulator
VSADERAAPSTDERLLDATGLVLGRVGWRAVTIAAVARAAGVSRQTLYKRFGSRTELAQAYVLREAARLVTRVETAITTNADDPRHAISAAFDVFLSAAAGNPLVRAITTDPGADELLELVTTRGGPVLAAATDRLSAVMQASWPELAGADADLMADVVVRLAISAAALPDGRVTLTGASLSEVLGPFADQALGRAPHDPDAARRVCARSG